MARRVEFAKRNIGNVQELIRTTIWSDETTVRRMPKGQDMCYRIHSSVPKENRPVNPQVQQGGFSVMFWGCFSIWGLGPLVVVEGTQNQHTYKAMLKRHLLPEIVAAKRYFDVDMVFMQDNAPCHKTNLISDFLSQKGVSVLEWPPQSPDMNPIENLWAIIKARRYKLFGIPANKDELIEQIFKVWDAVDEEIVGNLANSVQKRLEEVIRLSGRPTKY